MANNKTIISTKLSRMSNVIISSAHIVVAGFAIFFAVLLALAVNHLTLFLVASA